MRFEHTRGAAHKVNKALSFDATLRLKKSLLDESSPDCPRGGGGAAGAGGMVDYQLVATVSHHGRNAAGEKEVMRPYPPPCVLYHGCESVAVPNLWLGD